MCYTLVHRFIVIRYVVYVAYKNYIFLRGPEVPINSNSLRENRRKRKNRF